MTNGAILSDDKYHTYRLWRNVPGGALGRAVIIMLNPGTATAEHDDQAIRRCDDLAKRFSFSRYDVINLFSYRTEYPDRLLLRDGFYATGPDYWQHVAGALQDADLVIAAWGEHRSAFFRASELMGMIASMGKTLLCFGKTEHGSPVHPMDLTTYPEIVSYDV